MEKRYKYIGRYLSRDLLYQKLRPLRDAAFDADCLTPLRILTLSGPAFSVDRQACGGGGAQRPRCQKSKLTSTDWNETWQEL